MTFPRCNINLITNVPMSRYKWTKISIKIDIAPIYIYMYIYICFLGTISIQWLICLYIWLIWVNIHELGYFVYIFLKWTSPSFAYYSDVIMGAMAFQITSLVIIYSTVYSGTKSQWREKCLHLMTSSWSTFNLRREHHPGNPLMFICADKLGQHWIKACRLLGAKPLSELMLALVTWAIGDKTNWILNRNTTTFINNLNVPFSLGLNVFIQLMTPLSL